MLNSTTITKKINKLPQVKLAHLPTPLEECQNLTEELKGPQLFIKRDDCTGLAFGGNKTRIIEFTLGDALEKGADSIIQGAASQSNHARQLAAACAKLNLNFYFTPWKGEKGKTKQGNLFLDYLFGTKINFVEERGVEKNMMVKTKLAEQLRSKGLTPYIMGPPKVPILSTVAYLKCSIELFEQFNKQGIRPTYIYVASEGGTQAGLVLGNKLLGINCDVIGANPIPNQPNIEKKIADIANDAAKLLGLPKIVSPEDIHNTDKFAGEEYGKITEAGKEAIYLVARNEGILLDPVYTGKAMSLLINDIRTHKLKPEDTVVFIHTGGAPVNFAYVNEICPKKS